MWSPQDFNKILLVLNIYWYAGVSLVFPENRVVTNAKNRFLISGSINLISIFQTHQISKMGAIISLIVHVIPEEFKCK